MPYSAETTNHGSVNSGTIIGKPTNGDFVTAYTSPNSFTVSGFPVGMVALNDYDIIAIEVHRGGAHSKTYRRGQFMVSSTGTVVTIDNILDDLRPTDTIICHTNIPKSITVTMETPLSASIDEAEDKEETFTYDDADTAYQRVATYTASSVSLGASYTDTYTYASPGTNFQRVTSISRS